MTAATEHITELYELAGTQCEGALTAEKAARLEELVLGDVNLRRLYILYMHVHACAEKSAAQKAEDETHSLWGEGRGEREEEIGPDAVQQGPGIPVPSGYDRGMKIPVPELCHPPIILDLSATIRHPLTTLHSPLSTNFVGGPVFSYMVATVILAAMLLGAWAYKITHYQQSANKPLPSNKQPDMQFVGQITGMKDCRWSDPQTEAYRGASVPLSRKYALSSGLMEITYDSGAKVILEGPCTYEVESGHGGYLSLGKLTATVVSGQWPVASAKPQAANLQISKSPNLQIPNHSPLPTLHSPLFSVRTPTAVITDLGTEFGVEVSEEGNTTSHVFRGSVRVQVVGEGEQKDVVLHENESARVEEGKGVGGPRLVIGGAVGSPPTFARRLVEPPKVLDLLDIVAGGYGTGNRREHGIDPTTGKEDPYFVARWRGGDRQYRPVAWHRLIDGVFVPDGGAGPVKLDSAGDVFDGFPKTSGASWGSIWSRAAKVAPEDHADNEKYWVYAMERDGQFMPDRRGLLCLSSNTGITFNLEAVRRVHPSALPTRFCSVAGMADLRRVCPEADGMVDIWILVDGQLKLKREKLRPQDGTLNVDVKLGPDDRFLTLVVTDGGNNYFWDWVVFGDPVLQMTQAETD